MNEHYGVAGGGCKCGWENPSSDNSLRTLHMYENNPAFRQFVDAHGWPRDSMPDLRTMTMNLNDIEFTVRFSAEDDEWICTTDKFPSLSVIETNPSLALEEMLTLLVDQVLVLDE